MNLRTFLSLSKWESWLLTICFLAWGVWLSGVLQVTILSKEPQIHIYGPVSSSPPKQLIILLHSANSSGPDMAYLAEFYGTYFPDAVFVAPDSPFSSRIRPFSFSWYNRVFTPVSRLERKVANAAPWLQNFILNQLKIYNLSGKNTVIIGHSQGAVMGLYVAFKRPELLAGVLSFSGFLAWQPDFQEAVHGYLQLYLVHGTHDKHIPDREYYRTLKQLEKAGFHVSGTLIQGADHDINMAGARAGLRFLQRTLP